MNGYCVEFQSGILSPTCGHPSRTHGFSLNKNNIMRGAGGATAATPTRGGCCAALEATLPAPCRALLAARRWASKAWAGGGKLLFTQQLFAGIAFAVMVSISDAERNVSLAERRADTDVSVVIDILTLVAVGLATLVVGRHDIAWARSGAESALVAIALFGGMLAAWGLTEWTGSPMACVLASSTIASLVSLACAAWPPTAAASTASPNRLAEQAVLIMMAWGFFVANAVVGEAPFRLVLLLSLFLWEEQSQCLLLEDGPVDLPLSPDDLVLRGAPPLVIDVSRVALHGVLVFGLAAIGTQAF